MQYIMGNTGKALAVALLGLLLGGCNEGRITVSVTDAPVDEAQAVVIQFSSVSFERSDGSRHTVDLDPPRQLDLRQLSGGLSEALLLEQVLDNDRYRAIELGIDADGSGQSYVDFVDGRRLPLVLPEARRGDLRVPVEFDIEESSNIGFTVDFDLRRSLAKATATEVELQPALRGVFDARTGTLKGQANPTLIGSGCVPAVYLYSGRNVTPDDIGGRGSQPLTSATVTADGGQWRYALGFIEAGEYTVALTCSAHLDALDQDDDLPFVARRNEVRVAAGSSSVADF